MSWKWEPVLDRRLVDQPLSSNSKEHSGTQGERTAGEPPEVPKWIREKARGKTYIAWSRQPLIPSVPMLHIPGDLPAHSPSPSIRRPEAWLSLHLKFLPSSSPWPAPLRALPCGNQWDRWVWHGDWGPLPGSCKNPQRHPQESAWTLSAADRTGCIPRFSHWSGPEMLPQSCSQGDLLHLLG